MQKYVNTTSGIMKMLYDGQDCVGDYDDSDDLQRYYITPFMDENMLMNVASGGAPTTDYFYAHDGLGTIRQIFDTSHSLVNNYDYEGFGTNSGKSETIYNRFRYTGREFDEETESTFTLSTSTLKNDGLYYYRARTYDTSVGSFTSRDPIPARNLYPYCAANPINFTDPSGKEEEFPFDQIYDPINDSELDFPEPPPINWSKNVTNSIKGCKCAEDYIRCLVGKILSALGTINHQMKTAKIMLEMNKDPAILFPDLITYLNSSLSFFDTDIETGYQGATSFDYQNLTHASIFNKIAARMDCLYFGFRVDMVDIKCCHSSEFGSEKLGTYTDGQSHIKINTAYICKTLFPGINCGTTAHEYCCDNEHLNAHTIIHEFTHASFRSKDFDTYIGNKEGYRKLNMYYRYEHADTFARFVMNYFPDEPNKCKLNNRIECCEELKEDLFN